MKDHDLDLKSNGAHNPYRALLFKLTGQQFARPRAKTACNVWRKTQRETIEKRAKALAAELQTRTSGLAALRDKVARDMFNALPEEETRRWRIAAVQESERALKSWDDEVQRPPSTTPEDRQRCILGLVRFVQPILDLVCQATGWKSSFIAGGPEPAHGGKLNIISVHSGKTSGDIPLDFGTLEREGYKKHFLPMYGRFLKKCYSVQECHARALKPEDSLPLEAAEIEKEGGSLFLISEASGDGPTLSTQVPPAISVPRQQVLGTLLTSNKAPTPHQQVAAALLASRKPRTTHAPRVQISGTVTEPTVSKQSQNRPTFGPRISNVIIPPTPPSPPTLLPDISPSVPHSPATPPRKEHRHAYRTHASPQLSPWLPSRGLSMPPSPPHSPSPTPLSPALRSSPHSSRASAKPSTHVENLGGPTMAVSDPLPSPMGAAEAPRPLTNVTNVLPTLRRSKRHRSASSTDVVVQPTKKGKTTRRPEGRQDSSEGDTSPQPSQSCQSVESLAVVANSDAPPWFVSTLEMLQDRGLEKDESWLRLLRKWSEFEIREGYNGATRLPAASRPEVISAWLHRKRAASYRPDIDLRRYPKAYMEWWTTLQPMWRKSGKKVLFSEVQGDWETLRRPGINGLVNVLVSLFYWGCSVKESRRNSKDWDFAVGDCYTALTQLVTPLE